MNLLAEELDGALLRLELRLNVLLLLDKLGYLGGEVGNRLIYRLEVVFSLLHIFVHLEDSRAQFRNFVTVEPVCFHFPIVHIFFILHELFMNLAEFCIVEKHKLIFLCFQLVIVIEPFLSSFLFPHSFLLSLILPLPALLVFISVLLFPFLWVYEVAGTTHLA